MRPVHILLVEDNEGDILLTTEALEESRLLSTVSIAKDGQEAIFFLEKKGRHAEAQTPDLVLLDVNLPKKNGHEVLEYIKTSDALRHIPVIMLSTSSSERDVRQSYRNFASCYITKPVEAEHFLEVISHIENFWVNVVKLPKEA